jgi:hypothetical protein
MSGLLIKSYNVGVTKSDSIRPLHQVMRDP